MHLGYVERRSKFKLRKNSDLSDFEHGMVVGAILSVSETADLLGFFTHNLLMFSDNGPKTRKYVVSGSSVSINALLMPEVRGECPDWIELIEGNSKMDQI